MLFLINIGTAAQELSAHFPDQKEFRHSRI